MDFERVCPLNIFVESKKLQHLVGLGHITSLDSRVLRRVVGVGNFVGIMSFSC